MKRGTFSLWFSGAKNHLCIFHTTLIEGEIKYYNESFQNLLFFCIVWEHAVYIYGYRNSYVILNLKLSGGGCRSGSI